MRPIKPYYSKILIRSANWIGDAIMSTPTIRAIRRNFPGSHISILAKPWVAPLYKNNPDIDEILIYDAEKKHKGVIGKFHLARDLNPYCFDLAILLQNAFEAALITFLAKIPNRLGYNTDARTLLLTHPIRLDPARKKMHQIDYYLGIMEGAGLQTFGREQTLILSEDEKQSAEAILRNYGFAANDTIIGINPGAAYGTAKRWFPERYAELCQRLMNQFNCKFIILGSRQDRDVADFIDRKIGRNTANLCGQTSLRDAFALIGKCRLFITNDSGLMHAAAALNVPQIAIFGSTNHTTTAPSSSDSHIIRVHTSCAPCLKPDCPTDHRCMEAISVDRVYALAEKLMNTSAFPN